MWIAIGSWLLRFIGGILPTGQKPFGEWLGKILWVVLIFALCTGFMNFFFPHKPSVENIATKIVYEEPKDVANIGCTMWRTYIRAGYKK